MLDHTNSPERRPDSGRAPSRGAGEARPVSDREVPLSRQPTPAVVHAWLDGDVPESVVRQGDAARHVEFWHRINVEVEQRRDMRTPPYVMEHIMSALPQETPRVMAPWWGQTLTLSARSAILIGAGLVTLGVLLALAARGL